MMGLKLEIPLTPVEPDVLESGDVVEDVGADGLVTGLSSAVDCLVVSSTGRCI